MYAITVDQIDSRSGPDRVHDAVRSFDLADATIVLRPERTAGDEFQLLTDSAETALRSLFSLVRDGEWSVGIGVGDVDEPLPRSTRAATGAAFLRAREAVERAKRSPLHFAIAVAEGRQLGTADVEPLIGQTVRLRSRRSAEGRQLADLLAAGLSRVAAADVLGITPQAVAKRFAAADLRDEPAVDRALARLLAEADRPA